ncbi:Acyltransferase family protein [Corynebacterium kutscheri]|uniref:1-acyl-sn-glycerol-3-phosphate acyltransferase n=1 Tax=Corynebacterium kutscheri TaxID=35755 RepID=A0A0F6TE49_9CORY|nr:lysophospholipid acyltransferase family protein [Corynebacterium kutscheri]AKE42144.1 1-acyl-sn-glycerol-3-phosphate acyltransferase [Corynebacterium kutscheri]VEH05891.1 Acyltransferase family protein [Corynebacterium kutscheri]VEH10487.1 Acyltransferase family protein [Corynebacterium kutscheri]VEH81782.1 Acyltransferase family protein [Corynebacterium kutscheri]
MSSPRPGWEKRSIFYVPTTLDRVPDHSVESTEWFYNSFVIGLVKLMMRGQGLKINLEGAENIPLDGPALLAANHTGYFDFIYAGAMPHVRGRRLVRFMAKKEIFDIPIVGKLVRMMNHIAVDRSAGASSLVEAVKSLTDGNLVGIFPEGTISMSFEVKELKTGAARIAQEAQVPLIPIAIWGSQRVWTKALPKHIGRNHYPLWIRVGKPVSTEGTPEEVTKRLRETMVNLLDEVRITYDQEYGPFEDGLFWRPVSMGGSAPTPEEASLIEQEIRQRSNARKAEKKQKSLKTKVSALFTRFLPRR